MMLPIPSQTCLIQGLQIRYAVIGQGPPLLLLHGFGAMIEYWYKNIAYWSRTYQVIVCDLPGFGYSDSVQGPADIDYYVEFVKHFMDELALPAIYLVAHSLGGGVALRFSECYPDYVKKLVLISSVGFSMELGWEFRLLTLPFLGRILLKVNRNQFAAVFRSHVYEGACLSDDFVDFVYEAVQSSAVKQELFLTLLQQNANIFGIKPRVIKPIIANMHHIQKIPTLLLWGRQDHVLDYNIHTSAAKKILPNAPVVTIEQCGHLPQLEHSDLINETIGTFLQC